MRSFLFFLILSTIFISGCNNNSIYEQSMNAGKLALSNSEYDLAIEEFQNALSERNYDADASIFKEQTEKYVKAMKYYHNLKYDESLKLLDSVINMINGSSDLIKQAKTMREVVLSDSKLDYNINLHINLAQNYFIGGNYEKSLHYINLALKYIGNNENYKVQKQALYSLKDNCYHALK